MEPTSQENSTAIEQDDVESTGPNTPSRVTIAAVSLTVLLAAASSACLPPLLWTRAKTADDLAESNKAKEVSEAAHKKTAGDLDRALTVKGKLEADLEKAEMETKNQREYAESEHAKFVSTQKKASELEGRTETLQKKTDELQARIKSRDDSIAK